jgi:hypothetical protein
VQVGVDILDSNQIEGTVGAQVNFAPTHRWPAMTSRYLIQGHLVGAEEQVDRCPANIQKLIMNCDAWVFLNFHG